MARQIKRNNTVNKSKKHIINGITHIKSTFNNTIITITDLKGKTISWCSSGGSGFKGAKKGTPFAAQTAAEKAAKHALDQGMRQTEVMINGPGAGRETAIRALQATGIDITLIKDITPVPHNGCRPPKKRRV
uniref:Small ribosomal subunit protein uS11c n=1 Tax=Helminthocladia australis TaxID=260093 RepID=A0A1G4NU43_9FLOR|nr:Ribosomal protein S11 [Helminthocladia australis]SCW22019.1 Ribosomal protein S11 [Helminthocladia australis]